MHATTTAHSVVVESPRHDVFSRHGFDPAEWGSFFASLRGFVASQSNPHSNTAVAETMHMLHRYMHVREPSTTICPDRSDFVYYGGVACFFWASQLHDFFPLEISSFHEFPRISETRKLGSVVEDVIKTLGGNLCSSVVPWSVSENDPDEVIDLLVDQLGHHELLFDAYEGWKTCVVDARVVWGYISTHDAKKQKHGVPSPNNFTKTQKRLLNFVVVNWENSKKISKIQIAQSIRSKEWHQSLGGGYEHGAALPEPATIPGSVNLPFEDMEKEETGELLGRGSYGSVWVCKNDPTSVLKISDDNYDYASFARELSVLAACGNDHHAIVTPKSFYVNIQEKQTKIKLERGKQTLSNFIRTCASTRAESCVEWEYIHASIVKTLAAGLNHLHSKGFAHRDFKTANVIMTVELRELFNWEPLKKVLSIEKCVSPVLIIDFGLSRRVASDGIFCDEIPGGDNHPSCGGSGPSCGGSGPSCGGSPEWGGCIVDDGDMTGLVCTRWYRPPELGLLPTRYNGFAVDIWSLGVTGIYVMGGKYPWMVDNHSELVAAFFLSKESSRGESPRKIMESLVQSGYFKVPVDRMHTFVEWCEECERDPEKISVPVFHGGTDDDVRCHCDFHKCHNVEKCPSIVEKVAGTQDTLRSLLEKGKGVTQWLAEHTLCADPRKRCSALQIMKIANDRLKKMRVQDGFTHCSTTPPNNTEFLRGDSTKKKNLFAGWPECIINELP
jgi:serine/threonine protein kinase